MALFKYEENNSDESTNFLKNDIDITEIIFALLRRKKLIILTIICSFIMVFLYTLNERVKRPIYSGSFTILINDPIDVIRLSFFWVCK